MRAYQDEDRHLLDYGLATVPGLEDWGPSFRGPHPTSPGFVAFLGAAQTFGRLCADPFPAIVRRALGVPVLNLGHGGAGPEFYLRSNLLAPVRHAGVAVVQVMSARSQSSPHFQSDEGLMAGQRVSDGRPMVPEELFEELLAEEPHRVTEVVAGFQEAYVATMTALLRALAPVPTVLLWFSTHAPPAEAGDGTTAHEVLGTFPQLVTRSMVDRIRKEAGSYVEYGSSVGLPRRIVAADGSPAAFVLDYRLARPEQYTVTEDSYYPSPEMHREVAAVLTTLSALLWGRPDRSPEPS